MLWCTDAMIRRVTWLGLAFVASMCAVSGCGRGRQPEGTVEIRIPEAGIGSLAWVRLEGGAKPSTVWASSNVASIVRVTVPADTYRVVLGFANSNYQPPSELDFGRVAVSAGATQALACGLLSFLVRDGLPDLNLAAVIVRGGGRVLEQRDAGNTHFFFRPKPLPPGTYDVAIRYSRSSGPSLMATGVVVRAGETAGVALDSGLVLRPPSDGRKVVGWSLARDGDAEPWLTVRREWDNDEPLWRRFVAPPGTYRLTLERDPPANAPTSEIVRVESGKTLIHTPVP